MVASNALAVNVSRINFIGLVVLVQGGLAAPDKARRLHGPFHVLKVTAMGCFTPPRKFQGKFRVTKPIPSRARFVLVKVCQINVSNA